MARRYIFADEAGDFSFKKDGRASKYFIVCTVSVDSCKLGHDLLDLRRHLAWEGAELGPYFHASEDKQPVRDEVYKLIQRHNNITIQATIMEKSKAQAQVRISDTRFYHYGWFYHLKWAASKFSSKGLELHFTAAQIGDKKKQATFMHAVNDSINQTVQSDWKAHFWPSATDPCLQLADYCTWAIQRKWEKGDARSYDLIKHRITHEADMWKAGTKHYY